MRWLIPPLLLVGALALWLKLVYGSVDPCEALETAEIRGEAVRGGVPADQADDPQLRASGPAQAIHSRTAAMDPLSCSVELAKGLLDGR